VPAPGVFAPAMCTPLTFQHFASFFWCKPTTHGSWYPSGRPANQNYIRPAPVILSDRSVNAIYATHLPFRSSSHFQRVTPRPHMPCLVVALAPSQKSSAPVCSSHPHFRLLSGFPPLRISNPDLFSELGPPCPRRLPPGAPVALPSVAAPAPLLAGALIARPMGGPAMGLLLGGGY